MPSQTVLVTGGSSGIGKAIALALRQEGYVVYAGARRMNRMEDLTVQGIRPIKLDVTDDVSMRSAVQKIKREAGVIDILINNAGFGLYGAIEDIPLEDARKQLEVNLFGLARMTQLVLPLMRDQRSGKIINISSIGGKITTPLGGWYHASKFAIEGFSDSLRNEVKQFGIDVVVIEPGGVRTEGNDMAMDYLGSHPDGSVYEDLANKTLKLYSHPVINRSAEPPALGRLVVRIVKAKNPRPRYATGHLGWAVFFRRFMSDRMYDRVVALLLRYF